MPDTAPGLGHRAAPLGWASGVLAGVQVVATTGLVVGLGAVLDGSRAVLSPWLFVLGVVGAALVATARSTVSAWARLLAAVVVAVAVVTVVPLPGPSASGPAVLGVSALALAASVAVVVRSRQSR